MSPDATSTPVATVPAVDPFLRFARTQPMPVQIGTLAAGNPGGQATSILTWNPNNIPEVPGWCSEIDLIFEIPVTLTVGVGVTATMSPLAPYSALSAQMILAGSPEWPSNTSLVPFWLDEITNRGTGFDPYKRGPALATPNQLPGDLTTQFDTGLLGPTFAGGADTILPGGTVAGGGAGVTRNIVLRGTVRIQLQRLRSKMWGMIPLGDPQNRPVLRMQLNSLVGDTAENNLFIQDPSGAGVTAVVGAGGITCYAIFRTKSLDVLPGSVTELPQPVVGMGLNITYDNSWTINNAGAIVYQAQRTAQIYTAIHHLLVNGGVPIRPDYFALWLTQNAQSARWAYDASAGTMQEYYTDMIRRYGRYLPRGHMVADFQNGDFPDIPRETPYNGLMSPDVAYAAAAGVAATPNMSTALRVPAGTVMDGTYVASYSFGLVRVPY